MISNGFFGVDKNIENIFKNNNKYKEKQYEEYWTKNSKEMKIDWIKNLELVNKSEEINEENNVENEY
jgi:hypothetical protein